MNQLKKVWLGLFLVLCFVIPLQIGHASPVNMTVEVVIDDPSTFWNCTYFVNDGYPSIPSDIKLAWSIGNTSTKTETIIAKGKESGKISILAEKGAVINLQVYVNNTHKEKLGTWSLQVLNNGKTETIRVFPPASVQPEFNRD